MTTMSNVRAFSNTITLFIKENYPVFVLWMIFRSITSIAIAVASHIRPITEIERRIPIWPPSSPFHDWLERVLISPWSRWDVEWYERIIVQGYASNNGTANFHPLFPWLGKLLTALGLNPVLSLLIVSSIATLLLLLLLKNLVSIDFGKEYVDLALLSFLVFPVSFILFAPYPESLFLLFSVLCFISLRRRMWAAAGLSASLAVFTRQQGIFLIFPYFLELSEYSEGSITKIKSHWRSWITILAIPFAYILWTGYRYAIIGEAKIKVGNVQEIIYTLFISPGANKVVPNQQFTWPWNTLKIVQHKIMNSPDLDIWINTILALIFILVFVVGWKYLPASYRLYSIVIILISFSYSTGTIHPVMGLPRHLYLAFPVLLGITPVLDRFKPARLFYLSTGTTLMFILITAYVLMAWVP